MRFFSSKKEQTISISNDTIIRFVLIVFLFVVGWNVLGAISYQLTLVGVAIFLAIALNPAVTFFSRHMKIKNRIAATGLAYLSVLIIISGAMFLVVPGLVRQSNDFVNDFPKTVDTFQTQNTALTRALVRYNLDDKIRDVSHDFTNRYGNLDKPALDAANKVGGVLLGLVTVLVLAFMMIVEGPFWLEKLLAMQPEDTRKQRKRVALKMYQVVTSYVNGQLLIAAIAAFFAGIALYIGSTIAGVTINPIALAGIVFFFGLIPLIGNTIAAILVVLFCAFSSIGLAIGMAVFFLLYQQIENATLQPYIQSRANQLTALIVFVSALIGVGLAGFLGALAAIPIAGCLRVIYDEYIVEKLPDADTIRNAKITS